MCNIYEVKVLSSVYEIEIFFKSFFVASGNLLNCLTLLLGFGTSPNRKHNVTATDLLPLDPVTDFMSF
jgi:hypothetical protein